MRETSEGFLKKAQLDWMPAKIVGTFCGGINWLGVGEAVLAEVPGRIRQAAESALVGGDKA